MVSIDLNSDLGENTPDRVVSDDAAMLGIVSSANVACGFHAGDPAGIAATLRAAAAHGVVVGAHPGYRDFEGFGRRALDIPAAELQADIEYQLGALQALARAAGTTVSYVKPHGALYNSLARDRKLAHTVVRAIKAVDPNLVFLGLAGTEGIEVAEQEGLQVAAEAFADRAYTPSGDLVPRSQSGAVLHDPQEVSERIMRLVETGKMRAIDGSDVQVQADSICVHGDSAGAVAMARAIRENLEAAGIIIRHFEGRANSK
ncbi:hypothetical protein ACU19_01195 [Actinobaculum suis]|uniref:LamB/YcsF family protein n=1 Tax=Actinobaculum suis TaxID=1657 RepID=UPI00066FE5B4|nr:5-oxoprolinase subunit PxpA [Actinobaculum suis]KMY23961.1 hypothetical protein ACU19_01195 [Actinobaculum suis]